MSDWGTVKVEDIAEVKSGKRLPKGHRLIKDITPFPYIRLVDIEDGRIQKKGLQYLTEETRESIKRYIVNTNDVCLAIVGHSIGMVFYVQDEWDNVNLTENAARITNVDESFNPRFIYYYLTSVDGQNEIISRKVGSAQGKLPLYNIKSLELPRIPRDTQDSIVSILDSLTFKVELNHQTNQTLEHIAQTIFKSWFVDFEPTRAKIAARQQFIADNPGVTEEDILNASSDNPGSLAYQGKLSCECAAMAAISGKSLDKLDQLSEEQQERLKATAALFPDVLIESELGVVPKGWNLGELRDVADFSLKRVDTSALTLENYVSTENMLERKKGITTASSLPTVKTVPSFNPGQILISNIRPYFMKIWLARFDGGRSNDVLGIKAKDNGSTEYLYNLLYQDDFFNFMMTTSKGAKMPRGDKDAIMGWLCVQPKIDIQQEYSKVVSSFYEIIDSNNKANRKAAKVRDAILPKLLSGKITFNTHIVK